jgi:hypothetical protein
MSSDRDYTDSELRLLACYKALQDIKVHLREAFAPATRSCPIMQLPVFLAGGHSLLFTLPCKSLHMITCVFVDCACRRANASPAARSPKQQEAASRLCRRTPVLAVLQRLYSAAVGKNCPLGSGLRPHGSKGQLLQGSRALVHPQLQGRLLARPLLKAC